MKGARSVRRLLLVAALGATTVAVVSTASGTSAAPIGCTTDMCAGGEFHALAAPVRAVNYTAAADRKLIGTSFSADLLSAWLDPQTTEASDVLSVAVTITAVSPKATGWVKIYPRGGAIPVASALAVKAGQSVSNLVFVKPDATGFITINTANGLAPTAGVDIGITVDVVGWFSTSAYDQRLDPVTPSVPDLGPRGARLVASGAPVRLVDNVAVTAAAPLELDFNAGTPLASVGGSLAAVEAVLLNVTGATPTVPAPVTVQPEAGAPAVRSATFYTGKTRSTLVVSRIGSDGKVRVYNGAGSVKVSVDVVGVFKNGVAENLTAGRIVPLSIPFRVFDTRSAAFGAVPLGPNQAEDWSFAAFANSVKIGGLSVGAQSGLLGNLTNYSLARQYPTVAVSSSLTVYRPQVARPAAATNLTSYEATPITNMVIVPFGTNAVDRVYNKAGYAHYLLDVYAVVLS